MVADTPAFARRFSRRSWRWPTPKRTAPTDATPPAGGVRGRDFDLPSDRGLAHRNALATPTPPSNAGTPKYAGPLFDLLAPWADQWSATAAPRYSGPVSHYLGGLATVLGRYDEADAYFAQAAAFSDRASAKFFAARTNLSWGKMLAERDAPGDTEKARELLTNAHTAAAAHGYANVERRAAEALQQLD